MGVIMASTAGGFLIGFGFCLLLVCFGAYMVLAQYYGQIMMWRSNVEQIYYMTHSQAYVASMNALERLSPYVNRIADAISWIPGLGWLADPLRQIGGAGSSMRKIYEASEAAYRGIQVVEVAPRFLTYGILFGLILMVAGVVLVVRARRKSQYMHR
jgi:drug/metabolite transporter (DMT)-like permease